MWCFSELIKLNGWKLISTKYSKPKGIGVKCKEMTVIKEQTIKYIRHIKFLICKALSNFPTLKVLSGSQDSDLGQSLITMTVLLDSSSAKRLVEAERAPVNLTSSRSGQVFRMLNPRVGVPVVAQQKQI